ncbi:MAG: hypothetical protein H0T52_10900 [Lautropia sp.]|nr:hypothetical protein [Lautropia sp.]
MKHVIAVACAALCLSTSALGAEVGVSIDIAQPGLFGRIDIGRLPHPPVLYPQPVIIRPAPVVVVQQPIYLHVPMRHAENWNSHCDRYRACNRPVYFVQDRWYSEVYVPAYGGRGHDHDDDDDDRGHRKYKHRDKDKHHGRGRGQGRHDD